MVGSSLTSVFGWLFLGVALLHANEPQQTLWNEDYENARAMAVESSLPLLVWFTGSDWCVWCQKLESELFAEEAFRSASGQQFVAVKLDFPRRSPPPLAIQRQNRLLQRRFRVEAFPTVLWLCSKTGEEINRHGYVDTSAEDYLMAL